MNAFDSIKSAYDAPLQAALAHKREGGKVVGYISTAVPHELITASGAFPVMIKGDVTSPTPLADEWMEEQFDPMVRSIFEQALSGQLEFLDLLIVPRVADSFMRLYLYLREIERLNLCKRLPKLMQFDLLQSNFRTSEEYNLARFTELRDALRMLCGHAITNEALQEAIVVGNQNRQALRELLTHRDAGRITGSKALRAIGARYCLSLNEHTQLLHACSNELNPAQATANEPRVIVAGNAQDNTLFYEYIEAQGLQIVGDYQWLGDNVCARDIALDNAEPLLAIAEHYQKHALSSRRFPQANDEVVALAQAKQAQGVIFFLFTAEEALSWDVPNQERAARQAGLATLMVDDQPYGPRIDATLNAKIAAFRAQLDERVKP